MSDPSLNPGKFNRVGTFKHMKQTNVPAKKTVTLIPGDGIGPVVIQATRRIVDAAGARIAGEE